jgi:hypothetical protein
VPDLAPGATYRPRPRIGHLLALVAVSVCLVAGCSRGQGQAPAAPPGTTATTRAPDPTVSVSASARGEGGHRALAQAATRATPELRTFLTRYVRTAFDPAAARAGYPGFSRYFDPALRAAVVRDIASLTLGPGGARATQVSAKPAAARAVLLIAGGRPVAATVRLQVDATATAGAAGTPVGLRATFQLERVAGGWRIVAYDSRATVPR